MEVVSRRRKQETAYEAVASEHLECRDLRHAWKTLRQFSSGTSVIRGKTLRTYSRTLVCSRCLVERTDVFDINFDRVALRYDYPEGYQVPRTTPGARGIRAVRAEIVSRKGVLA